MDLSGPVLVNRMTTGSPNHQKAASTSLGWFGDPVVMRFTSTGPDKSIGETRARLTQYENHQQAHGFSKWIILKAASGVAIGGSGLLVLSECGWIDLGFRLAQPYWGQGFATEAALASARAGFDEFHVD